MKKLICAFLALSLAFLFCGCKKESELVEVKVSEVARSVFYAPQYVACAKGFFKDEGLDVKITTAQGADKVMTSVLSKEADIGFSGPEAAVYVYNEGRENYPKVFAQVTKRDGSFIVGRNKENFSFENLRGKKILGGRKGGVPEMTLEYVLKNKGLMPGKDVDVDTSTQFALMAGAFSAGEGDYVTLFEPAASVLENEGKGYVLASVGRESGEIPYTCYYAEEKYLNENRETVEKFVRALYKGQKWVKDHSSKEIAGALKDFFPDSDISLLEKVTERHKQADVFSCFPCVSEEGFSNLLDVMINAGVIKEKVPFDKIVDNSISQKIAEE